MSASFLQALCCTCGSLRECRRPRNHRHENYWLRGPVDRDWHRETGDLKCEECGRVTLHAIITGNDHAEVLQRVATGNTHGVLKGSELAEVRRKFRQGLPRNPELNHFWWTSEAQAAWDSGHCEVTALCGEPVTVARDPSGPPSRERDDDQRIEPKQVRDQEYEDPDTGLSWTELDCVDCLRVWHLELLRRRRNELADMLTQFLADLLADKTGYPKKIDLRTVETLIETLEAAQQSFTANSGVPR